MMRRQTKWIIKDHKALPSASVDKWGCHIKSGTWVDEVCLTLRHSVILDDVVANLQDFDFQGNVGNLK